MESSFQGELSEKPLAIVIGEVAERRLSGLLCLHRDESAKTVYFEAGAPVFAASDLPNEQLEHRLLDSGLVARDLIEEARQTSLTSQELGSSLVKAGALSQQAMEEATRGLAAEIIRSVFQWEQGGYLFYEYSELGLGTKLSWTPAECVLAAARCAAGIDSIAAAIAPAEARIVQSNAGPDSIAGTAKLNSIEAFVLSSITAPTPIGEVASRTGLPECDARGAICVLVTLGLLRLEDSGAQVEDDIEERVHKPGPRVAQKSSFANENDTRYNDASVEWVVESVTRKLASLASADYYGVLGIERIASTARITSTYQEIKQTFDSFRSRWPDNRELNRVVAALIAKIDESYETLGNPEKRSVYDRPPGANDTRKRLNGGRGARLALGKITQSNSNGHFHREPNSSADVGSGETEKTFDAASLAEEHYRRGRARFDRSDFHTAVYHFREAARLDASQSRYHYYLGVNLCIMAQARHARHSHTHDIGSHVTCTLGGGLARNPRLRHEAEQHMLKAAELDRMNPEITLRLARLYQDAGMDKKAGHYFLETLLLDAGNEVALRELGIFKTPTQKRKV